MTIGKLLIGLESTFICIYKH